MGKKKTAPGDDASSDGDPVDYRGPFNDRSCTDIICLILFLVCFVAFIGIGVWAYAFGDPRILLYPSDSDGNLCGYGEYEDRPHLFFFDLLDCADVGRSVISFGCPTPQVCVTECPSKNWAFVLGLADEAETKRDKLICKDSVNPSTTSKSVYELVKDEDCAAYYLESTALAGRCIPAKISDLVNEAGSLIVEGVEVLDKYNNTVNETDLNTGSKYLALFLNVAEYGTKILQDVRASWWLILVGCGVAMFWALLWILLMQCLAGFIVWLSILLFIGFFIAATAFCFYKYAELKDYPESSGTVEFTTNLDYYLNLTYTWLSLGIIAAVILLITLLIIIFLRKRISIAVALIKEASKGVGNMLLVLFFPLIPWFFIVVFLTYWGASAIYLASMGEKEFTSANVSSEMGDGNDVRKVLSDVVEKAPCDPGNDTAGQICTFFKYGGDEYTIYMQAFQLFMIFWICNFIIAFSQMTLAGSFGSYYWAWKKPDDIPAFPVTRAALRALRYHIGTMAFGSLLIAILQMIRVILEYVERKTKDKQSAVAQFLFKCLKCCFWCLEKILRYITKNAFIMTAIRGHNFCKAAAKASALIITNFIRAAVIDKVTDFVIFVGKLAIVGGVVSISWFFFSGEAHERIPIDSVSDYVKEYTPNLNFYAVPVIIIGLAAYVIACGFFSVYEMGVDTLFLCFLEDEDLNKNATKKRYYMSKDLMKILGAKNDPEVPENS